MITFDPQPADVPTVTSADAMPRATSRSSVHSIHPVPASSSRFLIGVNGTLSPTAHGNDVIAMPQ